MTRPALTVRAAVANDADRIALLGQSTFRSTYESFTSAADLAKHLKDFFGIEAVRAQLRADSVRYLLAEVDGNLAGFAKLRDGDKPEILNSIRALELQQVYVSADFQRLGVGGSLIRATRHLARDEQIEALWLSVWGEAEWAVNCYLKYGFETVGEVDFQLGQTVYNDLLMVLKL